MERRLQVGHNEVNTRSSAPFDVSRPQNAEGRVAEVGRSVLIPLSSCPQWSFQSLPSLRPASSVYVDLGEDVSSQSRQVGLHSTWFDSESQVQAEYMSLSPLNSDQGQLLEASNQGSISLYFPSAQEGEPVYMNLSPLSSDQGQAPVDSDDSINRHSFRWPGAPINSEPVYMNSSRPSSDQGLVPENSKQEVVIEDTPLSLSIPDFALESAPLWLNLSVPQARLVTSGVRRVSSAGGGRSRRLSEFAHRLPPAPSL